MILSLGPLIKMNIGYLLNATYQFLIKTPSKHYMLYYTVIIQNIDVNSVVQIDSGFS